VHAELPGSLEAATRRLAGADWSKYPTYLASRPDEAELSAIRLLLSLCREFRFRLHIVHLSTSLALDMLRAAKLEGLPVSVETCPHYLHLCAEQISDGQTIFKCAPPIRSRENCEKLWQGLREGVIDFVVTDHSPCPPEMKRLDEGNFRTAWGGIASLSLALPLLLRPPLRKNNVEGVVGSAGQAAPGRARNAARHHGAGGRGSLAAGRERAACTAALAWLISAALGSEVRGA